MREDPIVNEIRKYRDTYAKKFGYDLDAIVKDLTAQKKEKSKKLPKYITPLKTSRHGITRT